MTKTSLAARPTAQTNMSEAGADTAVNAVFTTTANTLTGGETVTIPGFRTFSTNRRSARQGRNPGTRKSIANVASNRPSPAANFHSFTLHDQRLELTASISTTMETYRDTRIEFRRP